MQIKAAIQAGTSQLRGSSDSARLDCELLLSHCLGKPRSYLFTWPEVSLSPAQQTAYQELLTSRQQGQPIAYLLGYREFWGLKLAVSPDTLIPRPETELLVEQAIELLRAVNITTPKIVDLGTGSGAIALALASELPQAQITATDISTNALQIAKQNATTHHLAKQITFIPSNWFAAIEDAQRFDLIISNPPYISDNDPHLSQGDLRYEPTSALVSGTDGLKDIHHLIHEAKSYLEPDGILMLEHGYDQGEKITHLMHTVGYSAVNCIQDLAGHDRLCYGHAPEITN